jgi:TonB family protein
VSIMFIGFSSFMLFAYYISNKPTTSLLNDDIQIIPKDLVTTFDLKKEEPVVELSNKKPEPPKLNTSAIGASISNKVMDSVAVNTNTVTNVDIAAAVTTSGSTTDGPSTSTISIVKGGGADGPDIDKKGTDEAHIFADTNPEFEGGLKGLYSFVASKLKYPGLAQAEGKEGTVYVKFVVDQQGKVGNLTVLNNVGYGLEAEAMRVVAMIPNFKNPGMINGKPVKVFYQLPIKFRLGN